MACGASRETPSTIEYQQRGMISRDMLLSRRRYSKSDWMLIGGMTTADSFSIQYHITTRDTMNKCDKLVEVDRLRVVNVLNNNNNNKENITCECMQSYDSASDIIFNLDITQLVNVPVFATTVDNGYLFLVQN